MVITPRPRSTDKLPPLDNRREVWKDWTKRDRELREDVRMKDMTTKTGPTYRYILELKQEIPISKVAEELLNTSVTMLLKMILAGSSELQKEIVSRAKTKGELVSDVRAALEGGYVDKSEEEGEEAK